MQPLLNANQKIHRAIGERLFLSPEAVALRSDPELSEVMELAALDHYLKGWKNLSPRYSKATGKELPGYELAVDDVVDRSELDRVEFELADTRKALLEPEIPDGYSYLNADDRAWLQGALTKHIFGGARDKIGELGTKSRVYPSNHPQKELRGTPIPAVFIGTQKRDRGDKLLLDIMEGIDPDRNVGLYGEPIDALHRRPAAKNPELLTAIDNIRPGGSSINQSVKAFEGEEYINALKSRESRLIAEQFALENGVRAAPPDKGSTAKADNALWTKMVKKRDQEVDKVLALVRGLENIDEGFKVSQ